MEFETQTNTLDILSLLEQEESVSLEVLSHTDPLRSVEVYEGTLPLEPISETTKKSLLVRLRQSSIAQAKFTLHYLSISTIVFFTLLTITNWSSYSTVLSAYINPDALKTSGNDILSTLDKSKITVYANEGVDMEMRQEQEDTLKKKLTESNTVIREDRFSPKKLITGAAKLDIDLDIAPYDNRIIIPKIGKNIPLVDVGLNSAFDFDHMENIFMRELEKGIVRYPGTAKPGEKGNAFIFGHSSNYPWMKGEYNSVFVLLDELNFGDEVIVYFNQKKFTYIIKEKKVVKPGNVKVLDRDPEKKELSLMTCWPIGTTINRLIVFAELQETNN
ncbi:MAG: sortase family protein [uncultured bacterium (gcode 4)]|uniref:Sortase family protein n=1 Tax=uncultured bacterium (gcode 4) TaxID=1234023 RepID=K1Z4B0_9BACT|nr:MAG: sortase family protein [uncultured bacterium (gcode 4)]